MRAVPFTLDASERWDVFCRTAPMATFLHSRRFLSYHGHRFDDLSMLVEGDDGKLLALLPAARQPSNGEVAVSHPGATYGGFVHQGNLTGNAMIDAFRHCMSYLKSRGCSTLQYKVVPSIYRQEPAEDDVYAMFVLGGVRYRSDLSCAISLSRQLRLDSQRQKSLKRGRAEGILVRSADAEGLREFWDLLVANLQRRHGVRPSHTLDEIEQLRALFPSDIRLRLAIGGASSDLLAGCLLFFTPTVAHVQYIAANQAGRDARATDVLLSHCIEEARVQGYRYFDFGISTVKGGLELNAGLHAFKMGFGGSAVVHDFFEVSTT